MTNKTIAPAPNSSPVWRRRHIRLGLLMLVVGVVGFFGIGYVLPPPPPESKNAALMTLGAVGSLLRISFFLAGLLGLVVLSKGLPDEEIS